MTITIIVIRCIVTYILIIICEFISYFSLSYFLTISQFHAAGTNTLHFRQNRAVEIIVDYTLCMRNVYRMKVNKQINKDLFDMSQL